MTQRFFTSLLIASPLMLCACGGDETGTEMTAAAYKSDLSQSSIIGKLAQYDIPNATYVSSEVFLESLEDGGASWAKVEPKDGGLGFTELELKTGATIEKAHISGLMVFDGSAQPERVTFSGFKHDDLEIGEGEVVSPKVVLPENLDLENMAEAMNALSGFDGGGYLKNAQIKDGTIGFLGWSSDLNKMNLSFVINDVDIVRDYSGPDEVETIQLESLRITNVDLSFLIELNPEVPDKAMTALMSLFNPYEPLFQTMEAENFAGQSQQVSFEIPQFIWTMSPIKDGIHSSFLETHIDYTFHDAMWESLPPDQFEILTGLDLLPLSLTVSSETRLDANTDTFTLKRGLLNVSNKMDYELRFEFAGLHRAYLATLIGVIKTFQAMTIFGTGDAQVMAGGISEAMTAGWTILSFNYGALTITERDFLDDMVTYMSKDLGVDKATARTQISGALTAPSFQAASPYQSELALDYVEMVQSFAKAGGAMRVTLKPDAGLALIDLVNAVEVGEFGEDLSPMERVDQFLKLLNIDFEHIPH